MEQGVQRQQRLEFARPHTRYTDCVHVTTERIAELRSFARIERTAMMERRGRRGEDPLITLADLPSIDELVVRELRDEMLEERGQLAEFAMARLIAQSDGDEAVIHRDNADRVEFELLREIAAANPELTVAAWAAAGRIDRSATAARD